ncbi:MAG: asparagine synthase (glutamine-hydrolyzing) [Alphaproteobacteria bacterium]
MCGIAGLIDFDGLDRARAAPRLEKALDRLEPRGPDDRGIWTDAHCALGHTRLAVIDLSPAAAQPMRRDNLVLSYNGEIYNFNELRSELEKRGHVFTSRSDTEILLNGWHEWGEALLPRLRGMFAFAIWDAQDRTLTLARDRFGKKPLLYWPHGRRFGFASDLVALKRLMAVPADLDRAALRELFTYRFIPEPRTILAQARKLPAGHVARIDAGGTTLRRWYDLAAARPTKYADEETAMSDLRERFDAAVAERLVADVPVGAFLSSGLDSALVAAAMTRQAARPKTFTIGFEGAADYYEERPGARAVAAHLGTEHTEMTVTEADALAALDAVFEGLDEPFADSSALPTYLVSREIRRHVTVALTGDGADEVFGGYRKYQGELLAERYRKLPAWLRTGMIEPLAARLPEGKRHPVLERLRQARRFLRHAGKEAPARQAGWAELLDDNERDALLGPDPGAEPPAARFARLRDAAHNPDPINAMLAADIAFGLVGDMLVKVDRMSMANGLEARCPFLDHRVVECAAAMPGAFKLAPGAGKRILRRAFADRLPADVFDRPKKGFEAPVAEWLTGGLADLARRATDPGRLRRQGLFDPDLPGGWYADLAGGRRDTSEKLWTLIAFQAWAERQPELGLAP